VKSFSFPATSARVHRSPQRSNSTGTSTQVQERRGQQAAEDDLGHGALDLVARAPSGEDQRHQGEAGGERGHQHRREPLPGAATTASRSGSPSSAMSC
jgi:hypothetical protein